MTGHIHPESADYLLLDEIVRDLDGKLGKDLLPLASVVKGLDVEAMRFMAAVRARKVAAHPGSADLLRAFGAAWMDGFTAGLLFQRAKTQGE